MDLLILRNELVSDPLGLGYAAMTDEVVAAMLNARETATYTEVPLAAVSRELIMMSDASGRFVWDNILDAAADSNHAAHDLARRLRFLFDSQLPVNWGGDSALTLLGLAEAAGFFTNAQAVLLKDSGKSMVSRGDLLGIGWIRPGEVAEARRGE